MAEDLQQLFTQEEIMERLQISRVTLYRLRKAGLPEVRVGRAVRFDLAAVKAWFDAQRKETAPPDWDWSIWSWVPAEQRHNGKAESPFWYEECRCRNETAAGVVMRALQRAHPTALYRVSQAKPEGNPEGEGGAREL